MLPHYRFAMKNTDALALVHHGPLHCGHCPLFQDVLKRSELAICYSRGKQASVAHEIKAQVNSTYNLTAFSQ